MSEDEDEADLQNTEGVWPPGRHVLGLTAQLGWITSEVIWSEVKAQRSDARMDIDQSQVTEAPRLIITATIVTCSRGLMWLKSNNRWSLSTSWHSGFGHVSSSCSQISGVFILTQCSPGSIRGSTLKNERDGHGRMVSPGGLHSAAEHTAPLSCPSSLTYWKPQNPARPAQTGPRTPQTDTLFISLYHVCWKHFDSSQPNWSPIVASCNRASDYYVICLTAPSRAERCSNSADGCH